MKRIALVAAIFAVAACGGADTTPATDTTTPTMAPAADTGMRMDTLVADTTDTTRAARP